MATASQSDRSERLQLQLKALPDTPGVYLFHGASDEVLYVGKAKSLRKRVQSYFRGGYAIQRTAELVERIEEIEVFVVTSETEALLLEQNLIKRHRPMFNIRLRDDKSYPYIAVTVGDEYPRVMFTRERHRKGVQYFGPYSSARKVRETLDVLNRVFPYRPCEGPTAGPALGRAVPGLPHRPLRSTVRRVCLQAGVRHGDRLGDRVPVRARATAGARSGEGHAGGRRVAPSTRRRRATATG